MIKRISKLRHFGIYQNFAWDADKLDDFGRYNLIYGWNYSGKTTLSRVFSALQYPDRPSTFPGSTFEILLDDDTQLDLEHRAGGPKIRVFNRDFVAANFEKEHKAPAIYIVGEENIQAKHRLDSLTSRRMVVERYKGQQESEAASVQATLDKTATRRATEVGQLLGVRNFRKPDLERRCGEVASDAASFILADTEASNLLALLRSGDEYDRLSPVDEPTVDIRVVAGAVNHLLGETAQNRAIEKLKTDPALESWVRQGLKLHVDKETCEFCGNRLDAAVVESLREHFSAEYEALLGKVSSKHDEISSMTFAFDLPDERRLFPDLRARYKRYGDGLIAWEKWAATSCSEMTVALKSKASTLDSVSELSAATPHAQRGRRYVRLINALIRQHNERVGGLDKEKRDARDKLERHYAATYLGDEQIAERQKTIQEHRHAVTRAEAGIAKLAGKISAIERRTRQPRIAAERLNALLSTLFNGSDITTHSITDDEFEFRRGDRPAENLSDGEKTAIAFAYFLISLEDGGNELKDLVVFIDDPISSLDSNHIYGVYALITNRLMDCRQLFVSTHNSEFFNLIKEEWLDPRAEKATRKACSAYLVRRQINDDASISGVLENLHPLLREYKSEYQFVFHHLKAFRDSDSPTPHEVFTSPNLLRKLLESYLGFRMPAGGAWHRKLHLLFDNEDERKEVAKFANDASHLQNLTRGIQHAEYASGAQGIVAKVLDALSEKDGTHYEALCRAADGATP